MYSFKSLRSIISISIKFGDNKNMILFILTMLLSHPNQYQPNDFNDNKQVILTKHNLRNLRTPTSKT